MARSLAHRRAEGPPRGRFRTTLVAAVCGLVSVAVAACGATTPTPPRTLTPTGAASLASAQVATATSTAAESTPAGSSSGPAGTLAGATPSPTTSAHAGGPAPWLVWKPSGHGSLVKSINLPGPWKTGSRTTEDFAVYTPPGYDPAGSRRYPVVYEAPSPFQLWNGGTNSIALLDSMIDAGAIPASIVIFIDEWGAPYPDSECANSVDGKMWMETFISQTVVQYLDGHYLTVPTPAARATMGMSTGGFCAAMLALRHPDVFGSAISFSGYYQAGSVDARSALPFGDQPAVLHAYSPISLVANAPAATRASQYFVVVSDPHQSYYGPQAAAFERALQAAGFAYSALTSPYGHGWTQVRTELARALQDWAARLANEAVFS